MNPLPTPLRSLPDPRADRPAQSRRAGRAVAPVLLAAALSACAPLVTQSPNEGLRPVNVQKGESGNRLMLAGHDVVAYFTEGRHRIGQPAIASVYKGVTFQFASAEHKAKFDADPMAYMPQYNGYCTNGIVYGIPWGGDPDSWMMIDGKLYMFGGKGSRDAFNLDRPANIKLADAYWKDEVEGSNAFIQRSKRMVFRVPHYKSGSELAKMVAESGGAAK
jgi:YHS domain-containing protein